MATRTADVRGMAGTRPSGRAEASTGQDTGIIATGRELVTEFMRDDVLGIAAEMSYRFLLALFPLAIFFAALASFAGNFFGVQDPTQEIMNRIGDALPADAASTLESQLRKVLESQSGGLLSIGIVAALWAGAGAMKAIMKGMNRAYDIPREEQRPFLRKNALAIGLTVLIGLVVIIGFTVMVAGQVAGEAIAERLGLGAQFATAIEICRWPVAIILLILASAVLYWIAPNAHLPFRWVSPGAVLFVFGWIVATALFGLYVSNFGSYANTYGALAGVVILLLFFYITSIILLIGAELNAVLHRRQQPETLRRPGEQGGRSQESRAGLESSAGHEAPPRRRDVGRTSGALGLAVTAVAGWRALTRRGSDEPGREARV